MQEPVKSQTQNKRIFRLVVNSAEEAVAIIQKRFGTGASVQSVKQHQPKGINKLWTAPKLEIIVSVTPGAGPAESFRLESSGQEEKPKEKPSTVSSEEAMPDIEDVTSERRVDTDSGKQASPTEEATSTARETAPGSSASISLEALLRQSEFDPTLIQRLKNLPNWKSIQQHSLQQGLTEVVSILRDEFAEAQGEGPGSYAAFLGSSGVGKTTLLRKYVANRVFIHGKKVQILKLDDEDPNPDDLLNVFCDLIGVNLVRDPNDLRLEKGTELYVDLPGVTRTQGQRIRRFNGILDDLKIRSRVLVMNSLYDTRSLSNSYDIARKFKATHQTFTHLDELENWAKLWKFVLRGSLPLIFLNMGDESTAAPKDEFLPLLVSKTFPQILLN